MKIKFMKIRKLVIMRDDEIVERIIVPKDVTPSQLFEVIRTYITDGYDVESYTKYIRL